ncbi:MAG: hypothetical protein AVDCRST_MAG31-1710, partial [uncultured Sphingomonas sp.]
GTRPAPEAPLGEAHFDPFRAGVARLQLAGVHQGLDARPQLRLLAHVHRARPARQRRGEDPGRRGHRRCLPRFGLRRWQQRRHARHHAAQPLGEVVPH